MQVQYIDPKDAEDCGICLEKMYVARKLLCGHYFHQFCIMQMIINSKNCCPICRADLYTGRAGEQHYQEGNNSQGVLRNENINAMRGILSSQSPNANIERVREIFPHLSADEILAEISRLGSVELAIASFAERL